MSEEIQEQTTSSTEQVEQAKEQNSNIKAQIEEKLDTKINTDDQKQRLRNNLKANLNGLQNLLNSGLINRQQGQNLLNHIIKTALENNVQHPMPEDKPKTNFDNNSALKEFEKEKPDFFTSDGRSEILNYLKNEQVQFDKDELSKIAKIVEQVEKSAIERYLKKAAHDKNLEKSNSAAKQRLQANAQKSQGDGKSNLPFTREQIGKMTNAEFLKNESQIMEQLKKGLIK